MADPFGFLKYERIDNPYRKINERIKDFNYMAEPLAFDQRVEQAARCMNCVWCSLLSYWCVVRQ